AETVHSFAGTQIGHANGMCVYDGHLYIATWHNGIAKVNATTMVFEELIEVENIANVICTYEDGFIVLIATNENFQSYFNFYDFEFNLIKQVAIKTPEHNTNVVTQGICCDNKYIYLLNSTSNTIMAFNLHGAFVAASEVFDTNNDFYSQVEFEDCYMVNENIVIWAYSWKFKHPFAIKTNIFGYNAQHNKVATNFTTTVEVIKSDPNYFYTELLCFAYPTTTTFYCNNNAITISAVHKFTWNFYNMKKFFYQATSVTLSNVDIATRNAQFEVGSGATFTTNGAIEFVSSHGRFSGATNFNCGNLWSIIQNSTLIIEGAFSTNATALNSRQSRLYIESGSTSWVSTNNIDSNYNLKTKAWFA
ncbi:MAG: hypothetical protein IKE95_08270, partial [Methanobrevibacter sp.]|nr:hypothetical protein [Methanobrevibacter sp.]